MLKCQFLEKLLCRGDIKVMELVAGLRSDWCVGALFSLVPVGAHVLVLSGTAKSESQITWKKHLLASTNSPPI